MAEFGDSNERNLPVKNKKSKKIKQDKDQISADSKPKENQKKRYPSELSRDRGGLSGKDRNRVSSENERNHLKSKEKAVIKNDKKKIKKSKKISENQETFEVSDKQESQSEQRPSKAAKQNLAKNKKLSKITCSSRDVEFILGTFNFILNFLCFEETD